jgi:lysophospholipase L1-like esterase
LVLILLIHGVAFTQQDRTSDSLKVRRRIAQFSRQLQASAQLDRYRAANAKLPPPQQGDRRVVFMGDSAIEFWRLALSFPRKPYINRGIARQTTSQMLLRFHQDVIELRPAAVVILAGSNDIAGYNGPTTLERMEGNLAGMVESAKASSVRVILASVLPVHNHTKAAQKFSAERPTDMIIELNRWMKNYCALNGCTYLDYYKAVADENDMMKQAYSADGLNPNAAGYRVMAPLTELAIEQALRPNTGAASQ